MRGLPAVPSSQTILIQVKGRKGQFYPQDNGAIFQAVEVDLSAVSVDDNL